MPTRNIILTPDEYYHIFNRGMSKQTIFFDDNDRARFLFLLLYFQSPLMFQNISRFTKEFMRYSAFNIPTDDIDKIIKGRFVEVVSFCLMPNHFHLIIKNVGDKGIATYMQRVLNSYTKYFNTKYKKSGHLFQGPYRAVHIEDDRQLTYLSAYIHKNPTELKEWQKNAHKYAWSSYQDFIGDNRWGELLTPAIILEQFKDKNEYRNFIATSTAKEKEFENL